MSDGYAEVRGRLGVRRPGDGDRPSDRPIDCAEPDRTRFGSRGEAEASARRRQRRYGGGQIEARYDERCAGYHLHGVETKPANVRNAPIEYAKSGSFTETPEAVS